MTKLEGVKVPTPPPPTLNKLAKYVTPNRVKRTFLDTQYHSKSLTLA